MIRRLPSRISLSRGLAVRLGAAAFSASLALGCSSSYVPAQSPRLSLAMENGHMVYVRDGQKFDGSLLGGDIDEAVSGNPRAEEYARQYKTGMETGFGMVMGGLAAVLGGATLVGIESRDDKLNVPTTTGFAILGAGLILELAGAFVEMGAVPHLYDAVNVYNDALPAR